MFFGAGAGFPRGEEAVQHSGSTDSDAAVAFARWWGSKSQRERSLLTLEALYVVNVLNGVERDHDAVSAPLYIHTTTVQYSGPK